MCMVSNIGDGYTKTFPYTWPGADIPDYTGMKFPIPVPGSYEFDQLRKEILELKGLLLAAKIFDEVTGQPDCEMDEKIDLLRKLGKYLGVDLESIFKKEKVDK